MRGENGLVLTRTSFTPTQRNPMSNGETMWIFGRRLHRLITKVRRLNRMTKYKFLPVREPGMPNWSRETWPDWYREHTKGEIIMLRELSDEEHGELSVYVDPMDFFRIVTGKVHPDDVQSYVLHQPQLF